MKYHARIVRQYTQVRQEGIYRRELRNINMLSKDEIRTTVSQYTLGLKIT